MVEKDRDWDGRGSSPQPCGGECEWGLVAVKRRWVPEWLWSMFKWVIPYQPFRWIFTTPVARKELKS